MHLLPSSILYGTSISKASLILTVPVRVMVSPAEISLPRYALRASYAAFCFSLRSDVSDIISSPEATAVNVILTFSAETSEA